MEFKLPSESISRTCSIMVSNRLEDRNYALTSAQNKFPLSSKNEQYIDKSTKDCTSLESVEATAVNGVVFLVFSGICIIILTVFLILFCLNKVKNEHYEPEQIQVVAGNVNYYDNNQIQLPVVANAYSDHVNSGVNAGFNGVYINPNINEKNNNNEFTAYNFQVLLK
jgi:hypothetical protein